MEHSIIYPLRSAGVLSTIIATIWASLFFASIGRIFWPKEAYSSPSYATGSLSPSSVTLGNKFLWILGFTAAGVLMIFSFFNHTRAGRAMELAPSTARQRAWWG